MSCAVAFPVKARRLSKVRVSKNTPQTTKTISTSLSAYWGIKSQKTHLKNPVQKSVVDCFGSADSSIGKEEGSDGCEDSVGGSDGAVDREVKHYV